MGQQSSSFVHGSCGWQQGRGCGEPGSDTLPLHPQLSRRSHGITQPAGSTCVPGQQQGHRSVSGLVHTQLISRQHVYGIAKQPPTASGAQSQPDVRLHSSFVRYLQVIKSHWNNVCL
mmetsp:Transcript_49999/g.82908  ORF Transcript_49999/g.82908 Transcript_49999/m.82908 type:complete len:117 (+) Transcript_49999:348-698(+)